MVINRKRVQSGQRPSVFMSSAQIKKQVSLYNDVVPVTSTLNAVLR